MKKLLIALLMLGGIVGVAEARRRNCCPKCPKKCCVKEECNKCEKKCPCKPKCDPCRRHCVEKTCDATKTMRYCEADTCDIAPRPCCYTTHAETCTWRQYHPATKHTVVTYTCPEGTMTEGMEEAPESVKAAMMKN